jgi:hypothetical protein
MLELFWTAAVIDRRYIGGGYSTAGSCEFADKTHNGVWVLHDFMHPGAFRKYSVLYKPR